MIKQIINLAWLDLINISRNAIFWVILISLLVMTVTVAFLLPAERNIEQSLFFLDLSPGQQFQATLLQGGLEKEIFFTEQGALEDHIQEKRGSRGIILRGTPAAPRLELIQEGAVGEGTLKILGAQLAPLLTGVANPAAYQIQIIDPDREALPLNLEALPPLLTFEVLALGFLLAAVLLFQEREEGLHRALQVSPAGPAPYIGGRLLVLWGLGLISGMLLILLTVGWPARILEIMALLLLGTAFFTLLGLALAVFFRSLSEWFFIGVAVLLINMAPLLSTIIPGFAPAFLNLIPSAFLMQGLEGALFGRGAASGTTLVVLLLINIGMGLITWGLLRRKIWGEGLS